ncbi:stage V sporulation protein B [Paenibacillus sp. y28]|uniref:stage V sporulation protein B n=1 Tax=Paenibacillus sp. y28 TaxID=3129110 RepID=UPI00301A18AE
MKHKNPHRYSVKQSFIHGTMILLAAGIINRILGFVPRIALPRMIGAEAVGLYQMSYPFMIMVLTVITGGVPLAIAKLVAEAEARGDDKHIRNIMRTALLLTMMLSLIFTAFCIIAAPWITTRLLTDSRVYWTFMCMTPMIIIVGISSIYRGFFQGKHNMIPTAASQIAETIVRIAAMLGFAYMLLPYGLDKAAAGAMLGVLCGEICGMLVLLWHAANKGRSAPEQPAPARIPSSPVSGEASILRRMLKIAIPVTASKLVGSVSYSLELVMIVQSLAVAGVASTVATAQYGMLSGMVIPVLLLPSALTFSLSVSLIPSLSEASASGDMITIHKRLHQSLRLALVTGAPFAVIMFVLAEPLCYYLYHNLEIAPMLQLMAPAALFMYFQAPLNATLQALDRPGTALLNTFIGSAVKLFLIYQLVTKPQWGIMGAVIAISANIMLVTILHWVSTVRLLRFKMAAGDFLKVLGAMGLMAVVCHLIMYRPWSDLLLLKFIGSMTAGVILYILCMFGTGQIDKSDLVRVPWIGRLLSRWF